MATSVRRTTLTLPAAPLGPDNPLPALRGGRGPAPHRRSPRTPACPPTWPGRSATRRCARSCRPGCATATGATRRTTDLDALVIENDRLRATVLPGLGGRVHSLHHKPTDRELLYRNPVLQPADFALNGAWFSGGIEWNIGATGHTTLSCAPLHAARVPAPDGGEMLRLWEWERLRDLPFQVDLWLPEGSDFLHVGVRIRNPHDHTVPVYWWSNTAVPEDAHTRVLAPAEEAWHFGYERTLRRVPVPRLRRRRPDVSAAQRVPRRLLLRGARRRPPLDRLPRRGRPRPGADLHRHAARPQALPVGRGARRAALAAVAHRARHRRLCRDPGGSGPYPAGARTAGRRRRVQLAGGVRAAGRRPGGGARRGLGARPGTRPRPGWRPRCRARRSMPPTPPGCRTPTTEPKESLATGSGWGALEAARAGLDLPGTPFDAATLGAEQEPWLTLLGTGDLPGRAAPAARTRAGRAGLARSAGVRAGRARPPTTTWASPSGMPATVRRRSAAGSVRSGRTAAVCRCTAWPSPNRWPGEHGTRRRPLCAGLRRSGTGGSGPGPGGQGLAGGAARARPGGGARAARGRPYRRGGAAARGPAAGRSGRRPLPVADRTGAARPGPAGRGPRDLRRGLRGRRSAGGRRGARRHLVRHRRAAGRGRRTGHRTGPCRGPVGASAPASGTTTGCGRCSGRHPPSPSGSAARRHPSGLSSTALVWLKVSREYSPW